MKAELKQKWVEVLRSGNYKQTNGWLRDDAGYCCLGVLCDIVDSEGWGEIDSIGVIPYIYNVFEADELLPDEMIEEINLDRNVMCTLAGMNDNGDSFEQIADYIEEHPEI